MRKFLLICCLFLLTGCKASLETSINITDLVNSPSKHIPGILLLEVAGCTSYMDSSQPSSSLEETQTMVAGLFPTSEYINCYSKDYLSFAEFTLPLFLNKEENPSFDLSSSIHIFSNHKTLLNIGMPPELQKAIDQSLEKAFLGGPIELNMSIKLVNDTDKDYGPVMVFSSFIKNESVILEKLTIPAGKMQEIRLSEVSAQNILNGEKATVLAYPFKLMYE